MKIPDIQDVNAQMIQQYQRGDAAQAAERAGASAAMKPEEKVDLSSTAKAMQLAQVEVAKLPDVREEKVQEIRSQVEQGAYNVSGEQIANKMVGESIIDLFA